MARISFIFTRKNTKEIKEKKKEKKRGKEKGREGKRRKNIMRTFEFSKKKYPAAASLRRFAAKPGISLRSWFQKKCLLPIEISILYAKIPPILKHNVRFFFYRKVFEIFCRK